MKRPSVPASVTIVALLVLSLTIANMLRAGAALTRWDILQEFAPVPGPLYTLLTGLMWAIAGGALFVGLGRRHPRAQIGLPAAGALYAAYWWADRLIFQAGEPRTNDAFSIAITILGLGLLALVAWGPAGREFFHKRDQHD